MERNAALSIVPPMPMPRKTGGHGLPPAFIIISSTAAETPSSPAVGLIILSEEQFSEPNPLKRKWSVTSLPSASSYEITAGRFVPVLRLEYTGSSTTLFL